MYLRRNRHTESLFDDRPPWHQAEPHAIIEHGVAPAGQHDAAAVDTRHALAIGHGPVLQASFGGQVLRGMRYIPAAQHCQQIARQDDALAAPLGQPLFGQEVGALLHCLLGLAAKAQVAQARAAADQLLVKPGGAVVAVITAAASRRRSGAP